MSRIRIRKGQDILEAIIDWIIKVFDNYEMIEKFGICEEHRRTFLKKLFGDADE